MGRNKNISRSVRTGAILQTRDENFKGQGKYRKPGYENKGNYRKVVVVDSNRNDDLAVVKLYSKSGKELPSKKSRYKPFVETKDNNGNNIRVSGKFIYNGKSLFPTDVVEIKKDCFTSKNVRNTNKNKVREIKGRK